MLASTKESFQRSFHTYDAQRASLQKDKGKFALVSEENIAGVFPTYEAALTQGYKKFGVGKFIVQEVGAEDRVEFLANVRSACPA